MKILVTGAGGYIGTRFMSLAQARNHVVVTGSRRPSASQLLWFHFDFDTSLIVDLPRDIDAVLHLAADTQTNGNTADKQLAAARLLLIAAKEIGAKFIFVSSQTASENAPTSYGRIKWRIEQEVLVAGGFVVRLGQVYGGVERGLFGILVQLVRSLPLLPAFIPSALIQPIHVDDCAQGVMRLIERDDLPSRVYSLASINVISFTKFLQAISQDWVRQKKFFFPTPTFLILVFSNLIGTKLSAKLGLHRLSSLFYLPKMDTAADIDTLGIQLRPFKSGMYRSGRCERRMLLLEGRGLLTFVLRETPSYSLVSRYVRMVEQLRGGAPLALPSWLFRLPTALALVGTTSDSTTSPNLNEFSWRANAAAVIAESSIQGATRFLGNINTNRPLITLLRILISVSLEAGWRLCGVLTSPLINRAFK